MTFNSIWKIFYFLFHTCKTSVQLYCSQNLHQHPVCMFGGERLCYIRSISTEFQKFQLEEQLWSQKRYRESGGYSKWQQNWLNARTQLIHLQCWTLPITKPPGCHFLKTEEYQRPGLSHCAYGKLRRGNDLNRHPQDKQHQDNTSLIISERLSGHYLIKSLIVRKCEETDNAFDLELHD